MAASAAANRRSDFGRRLIDEPADVSRADEHRVDARPLELGHVLTARPSQLGDRQLARGHVGEQVEHALEVRLAVLGVLGGEQEDLPVDLLEHALELLLVADLDHALEAVLVRAADDAGQPLLVAGGGVDDDRVRLIVRLRGVEQDRQPRRVAHPGGRPADDDALSALLLGGPGGRGAVDLDQHRDAVALRDGLAQPARAGHARPSATARGACRLTGRDAIAAMNRNVLRVTLLGAESTGKTTLAAALADAYRTVWAPEYGRVYTEVGRPRGAPWRSEEFEHIARVHSWYEDFLAGLADRLLLCDTDAFTTAVFHEAYLGEPARGFDDLIERRSDLYLVCGLDVPWQHDGWRDRVEQRQGMHVRYVQHARGSGAPWLLVEGPPDDRLRAARSAVDELLGAASYAVD